MLYFIAVFTCRIYIHVLYKLNYNTYILFIVIFRIIPARLLPESRYIIARRAIVAMLSITADKTYSANKVDKHNSG